MATWYTDRLRYCGVSFYFNLELRYCRILQICGMRLFWHFGRDKKFSFKSSNVFRAFSSFQSFNLLLIISQHATGCSLFCLFCLNRTFPNLSFCFRVIYSKRNCPRRVLAQTRGGIIEPPAYILLVLAILFFVSSAARISLPSVFCILDILLIQVYKRSDTTHWFVAVVLQILIVIR